MKPPPPGWRRLPPAPRAAGGVASGSPPTLPGEPMPKMEAAEGEPNGSAAAPAGKARTGGGTARPPPTPARTLPPAAPGAAKVERRAAPAPAAPAPATVAEGGRLPRADGRRTAEPGRPEEAAVPGRPEEEAVPGRATEPAVAAEDDAAAARGAAGAGAGAAAGRRDDAPVLLDALLKAAEEDALLRLTGAGAVPGRAGSPARPPGVGAAPPLEALNAPEEEEAPPAPAAAGRFAPPAAADEAVEGMEVTAEPRSLTPIAACSFSYLASEVIDPRSPSSSSLLAQEAVAGPLPTLPALDSELVEPTTPSCAPGIP